MWWRICENMWPLMTVNLFQFTWLNPFRTFQPRIRSKSTLNQNCFRWSMRWNTVFWSHIYPFLWMDWQQTLNFTHPWPCRYRRFINITYNLTFLFLNWSTNCSFKARFQTAPDSKISAQTSSVWSVKNAKSASVKLGLASCIFMNASADSQVNTCGIQPVSLYLSAVRRFIDILLIFLMVLVCELQP